MPDWLTIVPVAAAAWLLCKAWRSRSPRRSDLDWLPTELHDAKLVWSEQEFRCHRPVRVAVRIDRAYRAPAGELVLIEFKCRAQRRIQLSDVVELSVQRHVLLQAGHLVSRRAYVVVVLPDGARSRAAPVELLDAEQVLRHADRLVALRERRAYPSGPLSPTICANCGHRDVCPRPRYP